MHFKSWRSLLPPLLLGLALLAVYLRTLAPGLSWANGGADGGDLVTAAATGGVPHPTGYPLYLLLARLFQLLPAGSLAYRTNLMSAIFTAATCMLLYVIVVGQLPEVRVAYRVLAGLAAGLCFGLSPLVWSQAVITEVYALQAFLVVLLVYLYILPPPGTPFQRRALDAGRGLALGLALANHSTTLLLVPLLLVIGTVQPRVGTSPGLRRFRFDLPAFGLQLLGLALGASLYLVLPLRAGSHPPVSWGNPLSLSGLWRLVSGEMYRDYFLPPGLTGILQQARSWAQFAVVQLGLSGIFLGLLGLLVFGRLSRLFVLTAGLAIAALAFSFVYHPAGAEVYLVPVLISFSTWLGIGLGGLAELVSKRNSSLALGVSLLILGMILIRSLSHEQQVDASQDSRAEDFARQILSEAPKDAILFAEGDRAIFALWYFHFALHERPDLVVIARELVPYDWYQENLRHTYPSLVLPGPIVYPETIVYDNPDRPVCQVQYVDRTEMECTTK